MLGFLTGDINPFYNLGINIWNLIMSLVGFVVGYTPEGFSTGAWYYVSVELWAVTSMIGALMLNLSFYIGYIRQASNLKQNFTLEVFVECCIKVFVGNALLINGIDIMRLFFQMASNFAGVIFLDIPETAWRGDEDFGATTFYFFFGTIFFVVCIVCAGTIFLAIYGRYLQLYGLVAVAPIAIGTLPGGSGLSQTAYAWIRTFFSKCFEIVIIVLFIVIASKLSTGINFGDLDGLGEWVDGAIVALQNMATMILLAASVKGADVFMRRAFGL